MAPVQEAIASRKNEVGIKAERFVGIEELRFEAGLKHAGAIARAAANGVAEVYDDRQRSSQI